MSRSHVRSRPSMANRARSAQAPEPLEFDERAVPLTKKEGTKLRPEAIRYDRDGNHAVEWGQVTDAWREWYDRSTDAGLVFENIDGDRVTGPQENRYSPSYSGRLYAKLKDLERGLHATFGDRFTTGLLTLTASSGRPGDRVPVVDHLNELLASWEAVRRELHRALDGRRWEYLAVLEPHESGYAHVHIAVFVQGAADPEVFYPVIDAHLRGCDLAEWDAHDYTDPEPGKGPITVKEVTGDRRRDLGEIGNLGSYLGEYLGIYGGDPLDAPEHVQQFNALLWATGRQQWRPSNGAQELMAYEPPEERITTWDLVGVTHDGGETIEPVDPESGGVDWQRTWSRGMPPPTDHET